MTLRERRLAAAAQGMCSTCRCRKPGPGRKTCEHCIATITACRTKRAISDFNACCASTGRLHRFDCMESRRRAPGPYLREDRREATT
jgi:hypothetical protein